MKMITLTCETCGCKFDRLTKEHKRNSRLKRRVYCSRTCHGSGIVGNLGNNKGNIAHLQGYQYKGDAYTGFRYYMRKAVQRHKLGNLTLQDIKDQWNLQCGICAYSGVSLVLKTEKDWKAQKQQSKLYKSYQMASLDRIDSSRPYEKGNIQFVSASINLMKNTMSDSDTKELISLIRKG